MHTDKLVDIIERLEKENLRLNFQLESLRNKKPLLLDFLELVSINDCVFDLPEEREEVVCNYIKGNL